jgi:hypothetical protein
MENNVNLKVQIEESNILSENREGDKKSETFLTRVEIVNESLPGRMNKLHEYFMSQLKWN